MTNQPADSVETLIKHAKHEVSAGRLVEADFLVQQVLDIDPANASAFVILGRIAMLLGLRHQAMTFLRRARTSADAPPEIDSMLRNATALLAGPSPTRPRDGGILVIKAWGMGFWADVNHMLGALLLAELTGRKPVPLWGANSLYSNGAVRDSFQCYFEPISDMTPDGLVEFADQDIYPKKWIGTSIFKNKHQVTAGEGSRVPALTLLERPEFSVVTDFHFGVPDLVRWIPENHDLYGKSVEDVFRHLIGKYLRPTASVRESVVALDRQFNLADVEIAIHVRGTDKAKEVKNLNDFNAHYFVALEKIYAGGRILLLTEDDRLIPHFQTRFGDKVLIPEALRQVDGIPPHVAEGGDRLRLGIEATRDVYAAARAQKFLGNGQSNLSAVVPFLMAPPSCAYLIGKNAWFQRYAFKFRYDGGSRPDAPVR